MVKIMPTTNCPQECSHVCNPHHKNTNRYLRFNVIYFRDWVFDEE